jgi:hypothetical protein
VPAAENPDLSEALKYFDRYMSAVREVWESENRIKELAEELVAKFPELHARARETWPETVVSGVDANRLNRLIHDTPEQREIDRQRTIGKKFEQQARQVRDDMLLPLWEEIAHHSQDAKEALSIFRSLPALPTLDDLDPVVTLLRRLTPSAPEIKASVIPDAGQREPSEGTQTDAPTAANRRGPKTDMEALKKIAEILAPFGESWDDPAHLEDIFGKVDAAEVDTPTRWRKKEPPARGWLDGYQLYGRPAVQALEHRHKQARKHFPHIFASPAPPQ